VKLIFYTGATETCHSHAGVLKPGLNEIHRDELADQLLAAGEITGDFLPGDPGVRATLTRVSDGAVWDEAAGAWVPSAAPVLPPPARPAAAAAAPTSGEDKGSSTGAARPRKEQ
jgi:hypothetical protein